MFKTCAKNVRGWGQKSVGKLPHLPHFFYSGLRTEHAGWENPPSFTTKYPRNPQAFPRQILLEKQRGTTVISTVSTPPITTITIYI